MKKQLETFVRQLNDAWQREDWPLVSACYHPDVVLLPPDTGAPIIGLNAVVDTYREFARAASLIRFEIPQLDIYSFEHSHMVHMQFTLEYRLGDEHTRDSGLEIYAIPDERKPMIVWRNQNILNHRLITA
jgi:ketosteroid isomerase-like protein